MWQHEANSVANTNTDATMLQIGQAKRTDLEANQVALLHSFAMVSLDAATLSALVLMVCLIEHVLPAQSSFLFVFIF